MKRQVQQLICLTCVASFSVPVYAKELDTKAVTVETTKEATASVRAHNMEYYKKRLDKKVVVKDLGAAGGQPSKGVSFKQADLFIGRMVAPVKASAFLLETVLYLLLLELEM